MRRIAIAGTARSGKTVLLTSLIDQIKNSREAGFVLGKDQNLEQFREKLHDRDARQFKWRMYRNGLTENGTWPQKTTDTSQFRCEFKVKSKFLWKKKLDLLFFDFPGERVADAAIVKYENYADWSDFVIDRISESEEYRTLASDYLALQTEANLDADTVVATYKRLLADYFLGYKFFITPSTFILDEKGQTPQSKTREDFLEEQAHRYSGLYPDEDNTSREFAPLNANARSACRGVAKHFAKMYSEYRRLIVMPLFEKLHSCDSLIYTIDITSLLAAGVDSFNDSQKVFEDFIDILTNKGFLNLRALFTKTRILQKAAIITTKSDLVSQQDVESGKMMKLLDDMVHSQLAYLQEIKTKTKLFTCSSIESAQQGDKPFELIGRLKSANNPNMEDMVFSVPPLPRCWPEDWKTGEFLFRQVYPRVPKNVNLPPKQRGLNEIFRFICE